MLRMKHQCQFSQRAQRRENTQRRDRTAKSLKGYGRFVFPCCHECTRKHRFDTKLTQRTQGDFKLKGIKVIKTRIFMKTYSDHSINWQVFFPDMFNMPEY